MIKTLLPIVFFSWASLLLFAQENVPPPTAPFLETMPQRSAWRIDYKPAGIETASTPKPPAASNAPITRVSLATTLNKDLRRDVTSWSNGSKSSEWIYKGKFFDEHGVDGSYSILTSSGYGNTVPNFFKMSWIDLDHYSRVEVKNGKPCYVYLWKERLVRPNTDDLSSPEMIAYEGALNTTFFDKPLEPTTVWIDVKRKLPLVVQDEHVEGTFTFDLPAEGLTLPEACQKMLSSLANYQKSLMSGQMVVPP